MAKREMELSPRLRLLADWVRPGSKVADVGTDHAYLPVWLVLHGRVSSAIASDLRKGPIQRARENCRRHGTDGVDCRLCDGLSGIEPEEADTVIIAGMGGENIAAILAADPWTKDGAHTLLLQPMSRDAALRRILAENGYVILREALTCERGSYLPVMEVTAGEMKLTEGELYGGVKMLHDPLGDRYLIQAILRFQSAVAGLNRSSSPMDREKADGLRDILTQLMNMREEWRHANCAGN